MTDAVSIIIESFVKRVASQPQREEVVASNRAFNALSQMFDGGPLVIKKPKG